MYSGSDFVNSPNIKSITPDIERKIHQAYQQANRNLCDRLLREQYSIQLKVQFANRFRELMIDDDHRDLILDSTFLRVLDKFDPNHPKANIDGFIYKSLQLEIRNFQKNRSKSAVYPLSYAKDEELASNVYSFIDKIEMDKEYHRNIAVYNKALQKLPEECRKLLELRYPKEKSSKLSYRKILERFPGFRFKSENTAAQRLKSCREKLFKLINEYNSK